MEQKKSFRKVRCVNPKTNAIKYIPEHLVDELCLTYGLVEQDLQENEEKVEWLYKDKPENLKEMTVSRPIETALAETTLSEIVKVKKTRQKRSKN